MFLFIFKLISYIAFLLLTCCCTPLIPLPLSSSSFYCYLDKRKKIKFIISQPSNNKSMAKSSSLTLTHLHKIPRNLPLFNPFIQSFYLQRCRIQDFQRCRIQFCHLFKKLFGDWFTSEFDYDLEMQNEYLFVSQIHFFLEWF